MRLFKKKENNNAAFERILLESNFAATACVVLFGAGVPKLYADLLIDNWAILMQNKYEFIPPKTIKEYSKELKYAISIFRENMGITSDFDTVGNC